MYESLLGPNSTVEQRRLLYARYLAAKTEFWRAHRECAGVLHFCGLGYSRPGDKPRPEGGATSDHFTDLEKLSFEPHFEEYVKESFNPLGLMLDFWAEEAKAGSSSSAEGVRDQRSLRRLAGGCPAADHERRTRRSGRNRRTAAWPPSAGRFRNSSSSFRKSPGST